MDLQSIVVDFMGVISFNRVQAGYFLNHDLLNFKIEKMTMVQRENREPDQSLLNDLDRVIDYQNGR